MNATNCTVASNGINTDVSGIGARVAIYVTSLLGVVMAKTLNHTPEQLRDTARAGFITSTSLIVASFVSLYKTTNGLALMDALVVTMMTSLMIAYTFLVIPSRSKKRKPGEVDESGFWPEPEETDKLKAPLGMSLLISLFLHSSLWMAFGILVWSQVDDFGGAAIESCNPDASTIFWIVGYQISATSRGLRRVAIAIFSIVGAGSLSLLLWHLIQLWHERTAAEQAAQQIGTQGTVVAGAAAPNNIPMVPIQHGSAPVGLPGPSTPAANPPQLGGNSQVAANSTSQAASLATANANAKQAQQHADRGILKLLVRIFAPIRWFRRLLSPGVWSFLSILFGLGVFIYLIISTEMMINANGERGATYQWSFGQILSVALLIDQVFQLLSRTKDDLRERRDIQEQMDAANLPANTPP